MIFEFTPPLRDITQDKPSTLCAYGGGKTLTCADFVRFKLVLVSTILCSDFHYECSIFIVHVTYAIDVEHSQ